MQNTKSQLSLLARAKAWGDDHREFDSLAHAISQSYDADVWSVRDVCIALLQRSQIPMIWRAQFCLFLAGTEDNESDHKMRLTEGNRVMQEILRWESTTKAWDMIGFQPSIQQLSLRIKLSIGAGVEPKVPWDTRLNSPSRSSLSVNSYIDTPPYGVNPFNTFNPSQPDQDGRRRRKKYGKLESLGVKMQGMKDGIRKWSTGSEAPITSTKNMRPIFSARDSPK